VLSEFHAPAAASNDPGPGPLLNSAECTSGGKAIQIGAVMLSHPTQIPDGRTRMPFRVGLFGGACCPSPLHTSRDREAQKADEEHANDQPFG
jgi:hypothetical protein